MSNTNPGPERHSHERKLDLAALLRAAADDELSAHDERRLEALCEEDPSLHARIACDRHMRQAIARALPLETPPAPAPAQAPAPASLRERVAAAMSAVELEPVSPTSPSLPEALAPRTRSTSFWLRPTFQLGLAAAAMVAVAAVLVFLNNQPIGPNQALADRTAAASFVASEHGHCLTDIAHATQKFVVQDASQLPAFAASVVGTEIALADLLASGASDIEFVDAGPCHVPGGGPSMHLRFALPEVTGDVSLFVQRDAGRLRLDEGYTYLLDPTEDAPSSPSVYIWLRQDLLYYLVLPERTQTEEVRRSLDLPVQTRNLTDQV